MFKRIICLYVIFLLCFSLSIPISFSYVNADSNNNYIHEYKSVDEDLESFDFDYKKYYIEKDLCYRPILIQFNESLSSMYSDLLYVYDPNNLIKHNYFECIVKVSNDNINYDTLKTIKKNSVNAGLSSDGLVKRFSLDIFEDYRNEYSYREYEITNLFGYEFSAIYRFGPSLSMSYNQSINVYLLDAFAWSYRFDTDKWFDNFKDKLFFSGRDSTKEQKFYSFAIHDGWEIGNIEEISFQYKEALLEAYRHNINDTSMSHEFYSNVNDELYGPKFYKWNNQNTENNYDTSDYLGNSVKDIGNRLNYQFKTVKPESKEITGSDGKLFDNFYYKWNTILDKYSFDLAFTGCDIIDYSNNFMKNNYRYFIINYDESIYSYRKHGVHYYTDYSLWVNYKEKNLDFCNYLIEHGKYPYIPSNSSYPYMYLIDSYFVQEKFIFDIKPKTITYRDVFGYKRTAACSVSPKMFPDGGGGDNSPNELGCNGSLQDLLTILIGVLGIAGLILLFYGIFKFYQFISSITLSARLKENNKHLRNNNHDKGKKK